MVDTCWGLLARAPPAHETVHAFIERVDARLRWYHLFLKNLEAEAEDLRNEAVAYERQGRRKDAEAKLHAAALRRTQQRCELAKYTNLQATKQTVLDALRTVSLARLLNEASVTLVDLAASVDGERVQQAMDACRDAMVTVREHDQLLAEPLEQQQQQQPDVVVELPSVPTTTTRKAAAAAAAAVALM